MNISIVNAFTIAALGYLVGILIGVLADFLSARRDYAIARSSPFASSSSLPPRPVFGPRRPDGRWLPPYWWSGLVVQLLNKQVFKPPRTLRRILTEIGLPVLFVFIADQFAGARFVPFYWFYACIFALVIIIDVENRWILVEVVLVGVVGVLLEASIAPRFPLSETLQGGLYGFLILAALYFFGILFGQVMRLGTGRGVGRTVFGFGDVYMGTLSGLILGPAAIGPALLLMMLSGGLAALLLSLARRRQRRRGRRMPRHAAIPYGPHIVIGTALVLFAPTAAFDVLKVLIALARLGR